MSSRWTASRARTAWVLVVGLAAAALSGCAPDAGEDPLGGPLVIVTTAIIGDVAAEVLAGTDATVEVLMAPGIDPHAYAPSAQDARRLREADLVLANGLGLEASLGDVLDAASLDGVTVVELGPLLEPLAAPEVSEDDVDGDDHDDDDADDHGDDHADETVAEHAEHGAFDPHVWMDPVRVASMAVTIAGAYGELFPAQAAAAGEAANLVRDRYLALTEELAAEIATIPVERRVLVTNHDAFSYLGERFGLATDLTVIPGLSTQAEPSAAAFARLVEALQASGVDVVFTEVETSDRIAQALAAQVGDVEVVPLFSGSLGPDGSGAETLEGMLRLDVERIVAALG